MTMATKRKTKTKKRKYPLTTPQSIVKYSKIYLSKESIINRIKKHKVRFDVDYERGVYDLTPKEADIYDDSIDDILTIIRKLKK